MHRERHTFNEIDSLLASHDLAAQFFRRLILVFLASTNDTPLTQ
jgi:hypothetical protein